MMVLPEAASMPLATTLNGRVIVSVGRRPVKSARSPVLAAPAGI